MEQLHQLFSLIWRARRTGAQGDRAGIRSFDVPALEVLRADLGERIEAVRRGIGFVPNAFPVPGRRPDGYRASFAHHDAVMLRDGGPERSVKSDPRTCHRS